MENQQNPYETPSAPGQAAPPMQPLAPRSSIPKVFGILHIIYAAMGGIGSLIGLGTNAFTETTYRELIKDAGQETKAFDDALDSFMTISMVQSLFSLLFAVLILVAGIKLLKYQESGRKLSNLWAISRIVVAIPLTFVMINAQKKVLAEIENLMPEGSTFDMSAVMGIGGAIGVVLICVYPVISLILLNNAKSKAALK